MTYESYFNLSLIALIFVTTNLTARYIGLDLKLICQLSFDIIAEYFYEGLCDWPEDDHIVRNVLPE
jgi:hypothetical protein